VTTGLVVTLLGIVLGLATWHGDRTGELMLRSFRLVHRDEDPEFQPSLVIRYGIAAFLTAGGAITFFCNL
jgi:hypothetical protein